MKPPRFDYHAPTSLGETIELKGELREEASILAGGQSLVPMLNMRLAQPSALVDLNRIEELRYIRARDGGIAVGAMTRQRALESSEEAFAACPLIRETLLCVAHPIIRNRGTVGGSVAHADPAAELPALLCALGGRVTAVGPRGSREIPAEDFFVFHFTTALEPDEIVSEVWFPALPPRAGYAFLELSRRHGDFALCGVACVLTEEGPRLGLSGVGPRPILVESDEPAVVARAVEPADDIHATAEYRRELAGVLARRAVARARERARGGAS